MDFGTAKEWANLVAMIVIAIALFIGGGFFGAKNPKVIQSIKAFFKRNKK